MSRRTAALPDAEVVELLADEPELLAVADAVHATQPARRRSPARRFGAVAALVAVAALTPLALRDDGRSAPVANALAALGGGPVLHATLETRLRSAHVVDLATGLARSPIVRIEYWFDARALRLRTVVRRDGLVTRDVLQPSAQATAPADEPVLDPALMAFVTGYRRALAGAVRVVGDAEVGGRPAVWLELSAGGARERVALDAETWTPLVIVPLAADGSPRLSWRVLAVETIPRSASDFAAPDAGRPLPFRGDVRASEAVSSSALASLSWEAVWLGEAWRGLRVVALEGQTLTRGYPPGEDVASEVGVGVRVRYAVDGEATFVEISQAPRPEPAYAFTGGRATLHGNPVPPEGSAELVAVGGGQDARWLAQLRLGGTYVSIWASSRRLCLEAARGLRPVAA